MTEGHHGSFSGASAGRGSCTKTWCSYGFTDAGSAGIVAARLAATLRLAVLAPAKRLAEPSVQRLRSVKATGASLRSIK